MTSRRTFLTSMRCRSGATAWSTASRRFMVSVSSSSLPSSTAARVSRLSTVRLMWSTSSRVLFRSSRASGVSSSARRLTSSSARITANGVRSSCDASAMSCRCCFEPSSSRSSIAFRVSARSRSSSRATGTATRSCSRSVRIACASEVICSSGRKARRAIQKPTSSRGGQRDRAAEQEQDDELAHILLDPLETQGHDQETGRGGLVQGADQHPVALSLRTESKGDHLRLGSAGSTEHLGGDDGLRVRRATVVEDHLSVLGQDLGDGVSVGQHRLRRVLEVTELIGGRVVAARVGLLAPVGDRLGDGDRSADGLLIDVAIQVRPQLDHQERAERRQRGGQQGDVPRRQPDSDGQVHVTSRTNPLPRTVRMSWRLLGRSSFFRSWPM